MEIAEMQKIREGLETLLCSTASRVVDEFQRRTGLEIRAVYIDLTRVQTIGKPPESTVTGVRFAIEL